MLRSSPPAHLLDPPDVNGLLNWIRAQARAAGQGAESGERATAAVEAQLAAVVSQARYGVTAAGRILGPEDSWRLSLHPRLRSHRPFWGPLIVWVKKNLVRPLIRWHLEFTEDGIRKQAHVNRSLVALVEHLAMRVASLEQELARQKSEEGARSGSSREETR